MAVTDMQVHADWFQAQMRDPEQVRNLLNVLRRDHPQEFQQPPPPPAPAQPMQAETRYAKSIQDKNYRRMDKYSGSPGTWGEW